MNIYTISYLENLKKLEIKDIIKERGEILSKLISQALKNKKIRIYKGIEKNKINRDTFLTISHVEINNIKDNIIYLDENKVLIVNLNINVELNKELTPDLIYDKELGTSILNNIIEKVIDKEARIIWHISEVKNNNICINLLFPEKLILPDIVLLNEYKKLLKKAKKQDKENYRKEFEEKLKTEITELSKKRFNLIKNNHAYIPEDRLELIDFIKISHKNADEEAIKNIIEKYNDDEEIIMASINLYNHHLFSFISDRLKKDKAFILKLIEINENILEYVDEKLKDDDEIIIKAIGINGFMIKFSSERIKNDKNFCFTAIKKQAEAYEFISPAMREDNDLLMAAINQRGELLIHNSQIKTNKELLIKAFSNVFPNKSKYLLNCTSRKLKNDKDVALAAIKCHYENIEEISPKLKKEIGNYNAIEYLENDLFNTKLNNELPTKINTKNKRKI